jgi:dihydrofolate reductase
VADLTCTSITSLDGFIADTDGSFAWAEPDQEVHAFANQLERDVGTHLYGRRLYEVMAAWEEIGADAHEDVPAVEREYGRIWRAADKVVFSSTLSAVSTARTRLEHRFDPVAVRAWKAAADREITVGGAGLAASAFAAGLVDEVRLLVNPVMVGGGTPWWPADHRSSLRLVQERRFDCGVVFLRYRTTG